MKKRDILLFISGNREIDLAAAAELKKLTHLDCAYIPEGPILDEWLELPFIDGPEGRIFGLDGIRDFVARHMQRAA